MERLQGRFRRLGRKLGILTFGICVFIVPLPIFMQGTSRLSAFLTAIALAVAAVPEDCQQLSHLLWH
ncbi:MAG TPA: hypothetical protein EYP86_02860 [Candidatus Altiarchaeales archaeon]|nr:hypothetical protein [Candidatus Altiarchaeales archaeon]